jgi:hypothetical protein
VVSLSNHEKRGTRMAEAIGPGHRAVVLQPHLPYRQGRSVDPQPFAEQIISSLQGQFGLWASVGIASGKFAARVLVRSAWGGPAKTVPPGEDATILARP